MCRLSNSTTEPVAAEAATRRSVSPSIAERRIVVWGVLFTAVVLAYFYAADNNYFSTRQMTPIFRYLLMADDAKTAWLTLGVCILATFWRNPVPILKVVDFIGSRVTAVALVAAALLGLGAIFIYHDNAFCMDEYAAVFQAKIFAAGPW